MMILGQMIGIIGGVAFLADKNGSFRNSFDDKWDRFLSKHPIPFYYCVGMFSNLYFISVIAIYYNNTFS